MCSASPNLASHYSTPYISRQIVQSNQWSVWKRLSGQVGRLSWCSQKTTITRRGSIRNIWGNCLQIEVPKVEESRRMGRGPRSWAPPAGSRVEPRSETHFDSFWRPQTFLHLYADASSSSNSFMPQFVWRQGRALGGGNCPLPQHRIVPDHNSLTSQSLLDLR